jgi:hypothetical protein
MAPKTRYSVKRQPSAGFALAKRSCDAGSVGDSNSELNKFKKRANTIKALQFKRRANTIKALQFKR